MMKNLEQRQYDTIKYGMEHNRYRTWFTVVAREVFNELKNEYRVIIHKSNNKQLLITIFRNDVIDR